MLGESDLITAPLRPGDRMASMMAPTLAFADGKLELAIGAVFGSWNGQASTVGALTAHWLASRRR